MNGQQIIDANGAIHSGQTGRFAGHLQTEADADSILGFPSADESPETTDREEELRQAQQARAAAQKVISRAWAQDRLAGIRSAVEGLQLPDAKHPRGSISFGLAGNASDSIKTYIGAVPRAQARVREARARLRELEGAIDLPGLPQAAREAIVKEAQRQQHAVKSCQRDVRFAKDDLHMALWEARCEIERLEATMADGDAS